MKEFIAIVSLGLGGGLLWPALPAIGDEKMPVNIPLTTSIIMGVISLGLLLLGGYLVSKAFHKQSESKHT